MSRARSATGSACAASHDAGNNVTGKDTEVARRLSALANMEAHPRL